MHLNLQTCVSLTIVALRFSNATFRFAIKRFRPALADKNAAIDAYNTIFVGFPIWWYVAPTIINTFLETYDFSGKRIILFATSGGSGFGKTAAALKKSLSPDAALVEGKLLNTGLSPADLRAWCQSLAL